MTESISPLVQETLFTWLILSGGVAFASSTGIRHPSLAFSAGTGFSILFISFSAMLLIPFGHSVFLAGIALLSLMILAMALFSRRVRAESRPFQSQALSAFALWVAAFLKGPMGVGEWATADSAGILRLVFEELLTGRLDGETARGFSPAIAVATHPSGGFNTLWFPIVFFGILAAAWFAWSSLSSLNPRFQPSALPFLGALALVLSAPIVIASMFHVSGHAFVGLGLALLIFPGAKQTGCRGEIAPWGLVQSAGAVLVTISRPEGPALVALVVLYLFAYTGPLCSKSMWRGIYISLLSSLSAFLELIVSAELLSFGVRELALLIGSASPLMVVTLVWVARVKHEWVNAFWRLLSIGAWATILISTLFGFPGLLAFLANSFLGFGRWGGVFIALLAFWTFTLFDRKTAVTCPLFSVQTL